MIAKRTLHVTREELSKLFELPEGVEVLAVRANKGYEDGFEFLLASAEEVCVNEVKITLKDFNPMSTRKLNLSTLLKCKADTFGKEIMNSLKKIGRGE